jgi:hypothetical protein
MKHFAFVATGALLTLVAMPALATSAIDGVVTATTGSITVTSVSGNRTYDFSSQQIDAAKAGIEFTGGGIQSTSLVNSDFVEFQNGIMVGGPGAYATAYTEVSVTFTNTSDHDVSPTLVTVLDPLGLGFYIADMGTGGSGPCTAATLGSCGQTTTGATFADVGAGTAGFSFNILSDGVSIFKLDGSLIANGDGTIDDSGMADASTQLVNFRKATPDGDTSAFGYQWDLTPETLSLGKVLAPGESSTLTYLTTTYSSVSGPCTLEDTASATCLVGFSAFGDPIKSITTNQSVVAFARTFEDDIFDSADSGITGIAFNTLAPLFLPQFDPVTGNLSVFLPTTESGLIEGVPEPDSWALMIAGFGLVGGAVRRRRTVVAA